MHGYIKTLVVVVCNLLYTYLNESIEESKRKQDHASKRSGHQHNDADFQQFEEVPQHHSQAVGNHAVDGVDLLGEAVQKVPARRALEEGHGRAEHIVQQVQVQVAGSNYSSQRDGHGGPKNGSAWNQVPKFKTL